MSLRRHRIRAECLLPLTGGNDRRIGAPGQIPGNAKDFTCPARSATKPGRFTRICARLPYRPARLALRRFQELCDHPASSPRHGLSCGSNARKVSGRTGLKQRTQNFMSHSRAWERRKAHCLFARLRRIGVYWTRLESEANLPLPIQCKVLRSEKLHAGVADRSC